MQLRIGILFAATLAAQAATESDPKLLTARLAFIEQAALEQMYRAQLAESMTSEQVRMREQIIAAQTEGKRLREEIRKACKAISPDMDIDNAGNCKKTEGK